jgi:hypothetical protein
MWMNRKFVYTMKKITEYVGNRKNEKNVVAVVATKKTMKESENCTIKGGYRPHMHTFNHHWPIQILNFGLLFSFVNIINH